MRKESSSGYSAGMLCFQGDEMKLLIDIGNTTTSIAVVKGKRILKKYFILTAKKQVEPASLKRLFAKSLKSIDEVVIVSVVPKFLSIIKKSLKTVFKNIPVHIIGKDIIVPIKNKYKNPRQVGQDRLVAAYSASNIFKGPLVVVDFGTAVTFDVISEKKEYEGGLIFPGVRLALSSLSVNAALLPKVDLRPSNSIIGRDTKTSMNNGVLYGYASLCDGVISKLKAKYSKKLKVVATGGDAPLIAKHSNHINTIHKDLIFKGVMSLLT